MAKTYSSATIDVIFWALRCLHAEECIRGLPAVLLSSGLGFSPGKRQWMQSQP